MHQYKDKENSNPDRALSVERAAGAPINDTRTISEHLRSMDDRRWETRIRSEYFADVIPSDSGNEYHVLGVNRELYLFAGDIARHTDRTVPEILDRCKHGNEVYYPEPAIPHSLCNAVPGAYVRFSEGIRLIRPAGDLYYDVYELDAFRSEFGRRKQEA